LGFERIILCGVPMDETPHFRRKEPWLDCYRYRKAWDKNAKRLRERTRSMGGWTWELLGEPTEEWLR